MPADDAPMLQWALWYAALGWHVMPLHKPLFNEAGECIGCTCEAYQRSEANRLRLRAQGREKKYDPHYVCPTPGKHPRHGAWESVASNDPAALRKMGRLWRDANIGRAPGRDNVLVLDADLYKDTFGGGDLAGSDTLTTLTQGGGTHETYAMRPEDTYGQSVGDLPPGLDIRAHGGMVVLPPSIGPSGKRYQWEDGYGPLDVAPLPLPDAIRTLLDSTSGTRPHKEAGPPDDAAVAASVALVDAVLAHGAITHGGWQVWEGTGRRAILDVCPFQPEHDPHGDDGAAGVFIRADGSIGATCHHNRCKHEIKEHGDNGWAYLRELAGMPKQAPALTDEERADLDAFDVWLTTPDAFDAARCAGFRNPDRGKRMLDALAEMTRTANRTEIRPGYAALALASGISKPQIGAYLARWFAAGHLDITPGKDGAPTAIKLVFHNRNSTFQVRENTVPVVKNWNLYRAYRGDEAFLQGHHVYNMTRPNATLPALGGALNAIPVLATFGEVDAAELADLTGARYGTAARWLRLLADHALVDVTVGERNSKRYALLGKWREILDGNRVHMPTYAVVLDRRRKYKQDAVIQAKLKRPDRVDRLQADLDGLTKLWRSAVQRAGIVRYHRPDRREERLDKLRSVGERRESQMAPPDPLRMSQLAATAREARKVAKNNTDFRRMMHYAGYSDGDILQYADYERRAEAA